MWPLILMAASTLLSAETKKKAGKAEEEAGLRDYVDASLSGHFRESGISEKRDRVLSSMRARAAASGVEMAGSPLEVLANSASQSARDLFIARHITQRTTEAATRRREGGAQMQQSAYLEAALGVASAYMGAGTTAAGGYKPPSRDSGGVTEQDWMKEYGND